MHGGFDRLGSAGQLHSATGLGVFTWTLVRAEDGSGEAGELPAGFEVGEPPAGLLGPEERAALAQLKVPARRRKWLLGRVAAKRLVQAGLASAGRRADLPDIAIANEPSGQPFASCQGARLPWSLSISHREHVAVAGLCTEVALSLGIDLELVVPRDEVLVRDFFTAEEAGSLNHLVGAERMLAIAKIWSAKESVLKALGVGLRIDTREIRVEPVGQGCRPPTAPAVVWPPGWAPLPVAIRPLGPGRESPLPSLSACWRDEGAFVLTAALLRSPPSA